uniref:Uncharacterized protein n=1 Tax=Phlebotomus papatasi TaxID=29031 RepID=A0A1B0D0G6_PHLPP
MKCYAANKLFRLVSFGLAKIRIKTWQFKTFPKDSPTSHSSQRDVFHQRSQHQVQSLRMMDNGRIPKGVVAVKQSGPSKSARFPLPSFLHHLLPGSSEHFLRLLSVN